MTHPAWYEPRDWIGRGPELHLCTNCGHPKSAHPTPYLCGGTDGLGCICGEYLEDDEHGLLVHPDDFDDLGD